VLVRLSFVAAALHCAAAAQVNPFLVYPQDPEREPVTCTSFVGRPDWNRAAEALMKIDRAAFRALGDNSNGLYAHVFGIYHWVADERLSTIETYDLIVRPADANDQAPDMTVESLRIAGLTTPPSTNPSRGTWIMHDGFNLTAQGGLLVPPIHFQSLFVGVGLPANALWPASDGHSLFRADLLHANTGATFGENHRSGAPNPTWAGIPGASFSTPWTYILGPFVVSPNLHVGGIDPSSTRLGAPGANFGMHGLFPDVAGNPRRDGLVVRCTDNLAPFAIVALGACLGFDGPHGPAYASPWGFSHIGSGPNTISLLVSFLQNGRRELPIAAPGAIPVALVGTQLAFQGFVWDPNTDVANWTNAQLVTF
jgi:hypothetical protein